MLRRNLITIAVIIIALILSVNTFGQSNKKQRAKQKAKTARIARPNVQSVIMKDGSNNVTLENYRTGKRKVSRNMDDISDGNYRISKPTKITNPKPTSSGDQPELQITNSRKPTVSNLMKGHEGMQERKAAPVNKTRRKSTRKVRNFTSTTQPFADGIVSKTNKNTTSRKRPTKADHPIQDDIAYRKKPTNKSKVKKTIKRKRSNN